MNKNEKRKKSNWLPPMGYEYFFTPASDLEFKAKHPIGYIFLVVLGLTVFILPEVLFYLSVETKNEWFILGFFGGFIFGIGLFNFVAIIIKQYLGHLVSIISFLVGGTMMLASWILCH